MSSVLFVVMPFGPLKFPHIGVSLLKAQLRSRAIPASIAYLNFPFAEAVGCQAYQKQVKLCSEAGIGAIQPGIESLSANILTLMRKGVSSLQNVQLLKWCREYGVHPCWNVLYGFPGETAADYEEICRIAENLSHLTPPGWGGDVRVERFSPYFDYASDFGIRNVWAHASYRYIYPFDDSVLSDLAFFFDFDFDGQENLEDWSAEILALIERWNKMHAQSRLEVVARTPGSMVIQDTRPNRVYPLYRFGARQAAVIDACDQAQKLPTIVERMRQTLNGSMPSEAWIADFVRSLTACRLCLEHDEGYLSLILPQPKPASWPAVYDPYTAAYSDDPYTAAAYDTAPYTTARSQTPTPPLVANEPCASGASRAELVTLTVPPASWKGTP